MSLISSVAPNGVVSGPIANAVPIAVLQAQGAAGATPTAKLLLPNAVIASTVIPSYAPETPRSSAKPSARLISTQPSSPLVAQVIAQAPESATEVFAPFIRPEAPRLAANENQPTINLASPRPETPATNLQVPQSLQPPTNQAATLAIIANVTSQASSVTTVAREIPANENRATGSAVVTTREKRGGFALARGASAYNFAVNARQTQFTERAVEAVA